MRSIWKGSITFSLVSIPIRDFNAIETSEKISFNQLHAGDCLGPIGQKKQCKKCDTTVTNDPAAERSYTLLREVMKRSGRIGIAKVILREREDLITISPNGDGLMIQKLHYRHEVRSVANVPGISNQAA